MTLQPFQYQIGQVVFGRDTELPVSKLDIQTYNVNNQDFQIQRTDENRFGIDTLVPATIVFTMAVLNNYRMDNLPNNAWRQDVPDSILNQSRNLLGQLALEWKASDVRAVWGAMKMLLFADNDGVTRRIYGRPGKFTHGQLNVNHEWIDVQAEFRRADTYAYDDVETYCEIGWNQDPVYIFRDRGDAPAWFRLLFYGPLTHPTVTVGNCQVELNLNIPENVIVEVSSYPWMRRVVDSNNINWRAALIGSTQYLDQLRIPAETEIGLRFTDQSITTWTMLDNTQTTTNFDFLSMVNMALTNTGWSVLNGGIPIWGYSIQNGGYMYAPFGMVAMIDNVHTFTSNGQYAEVRIADIWRGTSRICIMGANDLTGHFGAQCVKTLGITTVFGNATANDKLRIVTGRTGGWGPGFTDIRFEFAVPYPGLQPGQTFGIAADPNTHTLYLMYNHNRVGSWHDDGSHGLDWTLRRQGFILNEDDSITDISFGVGLNNVVAYDATFVEPGPTGDPSDLSSRVFLLWRDAWNIV